MSAIAMPNEDTDRIQLLQGTLDMLILRTLLFGPAHGHQIAKHIQRTTDDLLQVEHGVTLSGAPSAGTQGMDRGQMGVCREGSEAGV
jgi:hypothetical protein